MAYTGTAANFLSGVKSIAVLGVSQRNSFGSGAYRELKKRGYAVYPVHPSMETFDGDRCHHSLNELPSLPDCLFVSVKPDSTIGLIAEAISCGIKRIWFQQGADFGAQAAEAATNEIETMTGRCILMYAEPVGGLHRWHQLFARLFGKF